MSDDNLVQNVDRDLEDILRNWDIKEAESIKEVHTGLLNKTFIIRNPDGIFILQKLHPAVAIDACTINYFHVTRFLLRTSEISQTVCAQKSGSILLDIDGERWRLLKGVEGDVYTVTPNSTAAFESGKLLSKFHTSIKKFDGDVLASLPMFQYKSVLSKLLSYESNFTDNNNQQVIDSFNILKENFPKLLLPENLPTQVIHTDPKISNFLFDKNGKGLCMIDLDTVQELSPLYDIGDCVRSICGLEEDNPNNIFDTEKYKAIIDGYYSVEHVLNPEEQKLIPQVCELIMLGLSSRFLNDYIDDNYFGWNTEKFPSRRAHNLARVVGQIALWKSFKEKV